MLYDILVVVFLTLRGVAAAAVLGLGFAFLIFLGDANARGRSLVSERFDRLAMLVVYLSWFGPLWWLGFSEPWLMVACGATTVLCAVYAASFRAAASPNRAGLPGGSNS
ncbi:hypothetical protein [Amaricoccus solimangrovi]|uniref:Uncharacterized protein n=1 Tax=Amaricoccus solimangrovi TaxID=2589815 RepID=A0A501WXN8_9RHOB|nr:hypothetical protein [Amaricoccus solimangrovi]TPE53240.1 hypothetical protein FJM51_04260 [Amaricoccus solimangrovi]